MSIQTETALFGGRRHGSMAERKENGLSRSTASRLSSSSRTSSRRNLAARLRFRAVTMTSVAFILGILPLVFASGAGAASRNSVGITVCGGMLAVAFGGVLLVPAFYVIIEHFNLYVKEKIQEYKARKKGK